jgi:DSF synthase
MSAQFRNIFREYNEISVRYDKDQEAIWCYFKPQSRPCFSPRLLQESKEIQQSIIKYLTTSDKPEKYPIRFLILASQIPGVFNFGGDLDLFVKLIEAQEREQLLEYAKNCIDICYMNAVSLHLPITTISLVQGSALGGGFESALSGNVLIAEEHAEMGVPEIRFNLFPGMGAYSFLARKCGTFTAEQVLRSGKIYRARELHEMNVVDILVESGEGPEAVDRYIKNHRRALNGMQAIQSVKQFYDPVTYEELIEISKIWVDAALRLTPTDLRVMQRIVAAQNRGFLHSNPASRTQLVRTRQDRRMDYQNVTFPLVDRSGTQIYHDRRRCDRREPGYMQMSS